MNFPVPGPTRMKAASEAFSFFLIVQSTVFLNTYSAQALGSRIEQDRVLFLSWS